MYESVTDLGDSLLLRLPGIAGTAKQSGHVGEIEVTDAAWGAMPKGTSSGELTIQKRSDKASSALYQAAAKNTTFAEAVLTRLTRSNKEVAQYRFKKLVLRRVETKSPIRDQYVPNGWDGPIVQRLQFDFASVKAKQEVGPPPTAGPRPVLYGHGRTI